MLYGVFFRALLHCFLCADGDLVAARSSASFTIRHDEALPVDLMQFRECRLIMLVQRYHHKLGLECAIILLIPTLC